MDVSFSGSMEYAPVHFPVRFVDNRVIEVDGLSRGSEPDIQDKTQGTIRS